MTKWQMTRIQYSFGLGILIATWIHFPAPRAPYVYAVAGVLTALRFRALGWKVSRAFIPFAIAAVGTSLTLMLGSHSKGGESIAHLWRFPALVIQFGMTLRAVLSYASVDPMSPRTALLVDIMAKRRTLMKLGREAKPYQAERERAFAAMMALHEELRLYGRQHGFGPSPEQEAIRRRMEAQQLVLDQVRATEGAHSERRRQAIEDLNEATQALKSYRRAA